MKHENRPLYVVALAVLVTGLVVGLAFPGVPDDGVLVGVAALGGLLALLFGVSRRDHLAEHDDHPLPRRH